MQTSFHVGSCGVILLSFEPLENRIYESVLKNHYKVINATGYDECLVLSEKYLPDLIFFSSDTDGGDSVNFCRLLKNNEKLKDIPLIVVSKVFNQEQSNVFFDTGAYDYIVKPGIPEEFLTKVRFYIKSKKLTDKLKDEGNFLKTLILNDRKLITIGAHDLKNPLKVIHGFSKLIEGRYSNFTQDDIFEFVKDIRESSEVMIKIISDMLDIINYEKDDIAISSEELNLVELIDMVIFDFAEHSYSKNIQIKLFQPEENYFVVSDFAKLRQIFENIISNALKFSSFNRNVNIKLEKISIDGKHEDFLVIISDEGPGINEEEQKHIFDIFSQLSNMPTDNEYSTRLGMAIVKRLSELLHIKIEVESIVGEGTTFMLTIPYSNNETAR